jgi:hypothetical protein
MLASKNSVMMITPRRFRTLEDFQLALQNEANRINSDVEKEAIAYWQGRLPDFRAFAPKRNFRQWLINDIEKLILVTATSLTFLDGDAEAQKYLVFYGWMLRQINGQLK